MDDIFELPPAELLATISIILVVTCLVILLIAAPKRDFFFFRWPAEIRFAVILILPALAILWPALVMSKLLEVEDEDGD